MNTKNYTKSRVTAFCSFGVILVALGVFVFNPSMSLSLIEWLAVLGGTFGVSRIVSRETVCEPVRAASFKVGLEELVTCPRCLGVWVALTLVLGMVYLPYYFLIICGLFSVAGVNILLQEVMGILVRLTDTLDMVNIPYTSHSEYRGESSIRIKPNIGE